MKAKVLTLCAWIAWLGFGSAFANSDVTIPLDDLANSDDVSPYTKYSRFIDYNAGRPVISFVITTKENCEIKDAVGNKFVIYKDTATNVSDIYFPFEIRRKDSSYVCSGTNYSETELRVRRLKSIKASSQHKLPQGNHYYGVYLNWLDGININSKISTKFSKNFEDMSCLRMAFVDRRGAIDYATVANSRVNMDDRILFMRVHSNPVCVTSRLPESEQENLEYDVQIDAEFSLRL